MPPGTHQEQGLSLTILLILSAVIVVLDQLTKNLSVNALEYGVPHTVFQGFDLLLAHNTGAAFSFLDQAGGWQRWLLTGISALVSVGIVVWMWRMPRNQTLLALALAFILGGALGNLYDRWMLGYVVDFISVYYRDWRFATFNIADAAISIGAMLMVLDVIKGPARHER